MTTTEEYLQTEKVYNKRLSVLRDEIKSEKDRLEDIKKTEGNEIISLKKTIEILDKEKSALEENVLSIKKEKIENERKNGHLKVSINSNKKDLKLSIEKRDKAAKQLLKKQNEVKEIKPLITKIKEDIAEEAVKLDKLTKKRIAAGQQGQVLAQLKEEIKAAYEKAGMKYPYDD